MSTTAIGELNIRSVRLFENVRGMIGFNLDLYIGQDKIGTAEHDGDCLVYTYRYTDRKFHDDFIDDAVLDVLIDSYLDGLMRKS